MRAGSGEPAFFRWFVIMRPIKANRLRSNQLRALSTSEKVSVWLGGICFVLLLTAAGLYIYGWHINQRWLLSKHEQILRWQFARLMSELSRTNGAGFNPRNICSEFNDNCLVRIPSISINDWRLFTIFAEGKELADITPLQHYNLQNLTLFNTSVRDLSPLRGMRLGYLNIALTPVSDLSPLKGCPLYNLKIHGTAVTDLSPLKGMSLAHFDAPFTGIHDLTPLLGMKLLSLDVRNTKICDLSSLKGMPLNSLDLSNTKVSDLSPLKGMPLEFLDISHTKVVDLSPLAGMNIKTLNIEGTPAAALRDAQAAIKDQK